MEFVGDVAVGVTSLAVIAGGVAVGVVSLAIAGVASLAVAGVVSPAVAGEAFPAVAGVAPLADKADSVASGVMCLTERSVQSRSVFGDDVCWDCCVCETPSAWCHEMAGVWDDSVSEYVNYVGHGPDCIDRTGRCWRSSGSLS